MLRTGVAWAAIAAPVLLWAQTAAGTPRGLRLTLSGLAGATYRLHLTGSDRVTSIAGGRRDGVDAVVVEMPAGAAGEYVSREVTFGLR